MSADRVSPVPSVPWLKLTLWWAASRLWVVLAGWLGVHTLPLGEFYGPVPRRFWDFVTRWDGNWYWGIATKGYEFSETSASATAFFPGYPWAMKALNQLLWHVTDKPLAGVLLSNGCFWLSGVLLWCLAAHQARDLPQAARRADGVAALFYWGPVTIFFSVVYTESFFFATVLGCLWGLVQRQFWLAGLCAYVAALTRNAGAFLVIPLLWTAWQEWRAGNRSLAPWIATAMAPLGTITFFLFLAWRFGDPFVFFHSQSFWERRLNWPWVSFSPSHLKGFPVFHRFWFVAFALGAIVLLVAAWRSRVDRRIWALGAVMMLFNFSANHLESIPRYLSVIPPLYLSFAAVPEAWRPRMSRVVVGSAVLLTLSTVLFVNGFWFT